MALIVRKMYVRLLESFDQNSTRLSTRLKQCKCWKDSVNKVMNDHDARETIVKLVAESQGKSGQVLPVCDAFMTAIRLPHLRAQSLDAGAR